MKSYLNLCAKNITPEGRMFIVLGGQGDVDSLETLHSDPAKSKEMRCQTFRACFSLNSVVAVQYIFYENWPVDARK